MKNTTQWMGILSATLSISLAMPVLAGVPQSPLQPHFQTQAQENSKDAREWFDLGAGLIKEEKYQEALVAFDAAIALQKDFAEAWIYRGLALSGLSRWQEAFESYDRATQIVPDSSLAWANRGRALSKLGRDQEAVYSLNLALQVNKNWGAGSPILAWLQRGLVLENLGQNQEALNSYEAALKLDPTNPVAIERRNRLQEKLGTR